MKLLLGLILAIGLQAEARKNKNRDFDRDHDRQQQEQNYRDNRSNRSYPIGPDMRLTPGSLCTRPDYRRYPEQIAYCERNVETQRKYQIIDNYNRELGYKIERSQRQQFKIDHYIPLCMGGSNETNNLWPQHVTVYNQTDSLEGLLCEKMKAGRLLQVKAIEYIKTAKKDLSRVREITNEVNRL
jgi:hypothetical protein